MEKYFYILLVLYILYFHFSIFYFGFHNYYPPVSRINGHASINLAKYEEGQRILKVIKPNDFVIIAGKGHENYQILKDKTIHFDDREVVLEYWSEK